jgi:hypothetical protein
MSELLTPQTLERISDVAEVASLTGLVRIFEPEIQLCHLPRSPDPLIERYLATAAPRLGEGFRQVVEVQQGCAADLLPDLPGPPGRLCRRYRFYRGSVWRSARLLSASMHAAGGDSPAPCVRVFMLIAPASACSAPIAGPAPSGWPSRMRRNVGGSGHGAGGLPMMSTPGLIVAAEAGVGRGACRLPSPC